MTLGEFEKTARRLQFFVFAVPLISRIFDHRSGIPFPPMGDDPAPWRFVAVAIVGSAATLPYFVSPQKRRASVIASLFILFVLACAAYLSLEARYVVPIPVPGGAVRYVTRGTIRNPRLQEPYASMKDDELIRNSGQADSALGHVYTEESLRANRQKLFWSYVLALVLLELMLGSVARADTTVAAVDHQA